MIRSCQEYGSEVDGSTCNTYIEKLDRIQSQCVRMCLRALWHTPMAALQVQCGVMPLDCRRNMAQVKSALKYKCIRTAKLERKTELYEPFLF